MVYTTFAIIGTSLLILLFAFTSTTDDYTSDENPFRIGEASYYLQNVEGDLSRAHQIATRRAGSATVNYTVRNGEPVPNLEEALTNITLNGSTEDFDVVVKNSSLNSWKKTVIASAQESRYDLSIEFRDIHHDDNYLDLQSTLEISTQLEDPITSSTFNNTFNQTTEASFEGYEDTMLLLRSEDAYINTYKACTFQRPAQQITTGTDSNEGTTYGEATSDSTAEDPGEKILVSTEPENGEAFAGVITDDSLDYNSTKYVSGVPGTELGEIENGTDLILYQNQVWNSNIREIINTGCYMRSTVEESEAPAGPGVLERMKNQLEAEEGETQGLLTLIDKSRMPQQLQYLERSNVGYEYFRGQEGQGIAGITGQEAFNPERDGYRNGFRLDQQHIERWNLTGLTY